MSDTSPTDIRRAAMNLLARREHGRQELEQKLARRFPDEAGEITRQVERLSEEGLQSDARLAEAFIRARANRGQGPVRIRMELRAKGVDDALVDQAFDCCDINWFQQIRQVAEKKFGEVTSLMDHRERARRSRFLQQRGFTFDHIGSLD